MAILKDESTLSFFEMTPDLVCIAGKDGFLKMVNKAVTNTLEYTEEEIFSRPINAFIHQDDVALTSARRARLTEGEVITDFENRYITKTGKIVWLHWTSIYLSDRQVVFAIAKNVTERKNREIAAAEQRNKFKELAQHFKEKIENDRRHFAGELREEVAQLASVIKLNADWLLRNTPTESSILVVERLESISELSVMLIKHIRKISFTISPSVLEDFGLTDTLKLLCKEFTAINHIPCSFTGSYNEDNLSKEIQLDFFRICQEALLNVVQHAQAGKVDISIVQSGNTVILSIKDDGAGFNIALYENAAGLRGMQDLTASINGDFAIESSPENGTSISITITLQ